MHPSTLSAADFACGMYVLVLCPSQNPLLSRIWVHLPHLEEIGGHMLSRIWTHLVRLEEVDRDQFLPIDFATA